jgi:hypothetical protein
VVLGARDGARVAVADGAAAAGADVAGGAATGMEIGAARSTAAGAAGVTDAASTIEGLPARSGSTAATVVTARSAMSAPRPKAANLDCMAAAPALGPGRRARVVLSSVAALCGRTVEPPWRLRGGLAAGVEASALCDIRPSTVKRHLADLRARSGLTTEQLI